jgi:hypothetical protein
MKTKFFYIILLLAGFSAPSFCQEKTKKQIKEEQEITAQKQTEDLLSSKEFVFTGTIAYPTGYRSVNLTLIQNFVKFHPDMVECSMPYYGRASSSAAYSSSNSGGFKFEGKPENFTVTKRKKNYQVEAQVKTEGESYRLTMIVELSGSTSLTIISLNRSPISYSGQIAPISAP